MDGTFKIVHIIDLTIYEKFLQQVQTYVDENIPFTNLFYRILTQELNQTNEILQSLKPLNTNKSKRSINIIGTAWKYIAGTPDHDDFEILGKNMNELNINNNKQILINQELNEQMNELTKRFNEINNVIKKESYLSSEIAIHFQNKIRLIKEEIINIKYAIQWAKNGIINSILLNKLEIKLAIEKLEQEKMPFASVEEAVEYAKKLMLSIRIQ